MSRPEVGKKAPSFSLPQFPEGTFKLADAKGKYVVVYFYPRDNTPGCTQEACDFRDYLERLRDDSIIVVGISTDSVDSHQKFAEKFELEFPLLADTDHAVAERYGVWVEKKNYGKTYMGLQRATFLIDPEGRIAHVWPKVTAKGHVAKVAEKLASLRG